MHDYESRLLLLLGWAGRRTVRAAWRALAVVAAVGVLTAGCGFVHVHFGSGSSRSATFRPNPAFVQCMRSHGLTKFPNANPANSITVQLTGNSSVARAYYACKHLLGSG